MLTVSALRVAPYSRYFYIHRNSLLVVSSQNTAFIPRYSLWEYLRCASRVATAVGAGAAHKTPRKLPSAVA